MTERGRAACPTPPPQTPYTAPMPTDHDSERHDPERRRSKSADLQLFIAVFFMCVGFSGTFLALGYIIGRLT